MKYSVGTKTYVNILNLIVKKYIRDKHLLKQIKINTREIFERASDIGQNNTLLGSYILAAYFIAMVRTTNYSPEKCHQILNDGLRGSKIFKMFMGSSKDYFSEKRMEARRKWSKETHQHKYKNDWVVNVIEGDGTFTFGFDYLECGVCKLCRDEGCPEYAKYLCRLDFMIAEVMGMKLKRTTTLAEGGKCCDFRYIK